MPPPQGITFLQIIGKLYNVPEPNQPQLIQAAKTKYNFAKLEQLAKTYAAVP